MRKNGCKTGFPALPPHNFSCKLILLISTVIILFFSSNLELICACEFFKKLKLHFPKWLEQCQLFEKLTCANYFQIEREKL